MFIKDIFKAVKSTAKLIDKSISKITTKVVDYLDSKIDKDDDDENLNTKFNKDDIENIIIEKEDKDESKTN